MGLRASVAVAEPNSEQMPPWYGLGCHEGSRLGQGGLDLSRPLLCRVFAESCECGWLSLVSEAGYGEKLMACWCALVNASTHGYALAISK